METTIGFGVQGIGCTYIYMIYIYICVAIMERTWKILFRAQSSYLG